MKATITLSNIVVAAAVGAYAFQPANASSTPAPVRGRWVAATTSATTYWNKDNGQYLGNGSGSGQVYEFDAAGNFKYYMLMEVRTGGMYTQVRTDCKGKVSFNGGNFTLRATSGHYNTQMSGRTSSRSMKAADLTRMSRTYNWRMEKGNDGKPNLIVFFSDGSKFVFTPLNK